MYPLLHLQHWLHGIGKLRGFGIQSPWAYDFVKEVVAERSPYYKYGELDHNTHVQGSDQRLCHLLLRIANFCQPQAIYIEPKTPTPYHAYIKGGCERADIVSNPQDAQLLLLSVLSPNIAETISHLPSTVNQEPPTILLLGINDTPSTLEIWNHIISNPPCTLTFNLWKMGVIFTHERYQPQHYILNF